jgi:bidirectional [NiFe] hydrogenase diaphorase subunit
MNDAATQLDRAISRHQNSGDALIEVLHVAQQLYGYLSPELLKRIARDLRLPPSKVLGVATFYHLFRFAPCREHTATVCMGTACYTAGGERLLTAARECASGSWTVESGRCVGSCGLAPVVLCDGEAVSRITADELARRVKDSHDG